MANSFLLLLDDIVAVADDVASMSKMAFKKTAGVLGDDLALNAEQVSGVKTNRELPVVFSVFKGSLINKLILVPLALLISYFLPVLMTPLLMIGGAFLCFEGVENLYEKFFHKDKVKDHQEQHKNNINLSPEDLVAFEKKKIKGAIRTDFILSAEIIVISLSAIENFPVLQRIIALSVLALFFTFFVYGLVALIVRLDDIGFWLQKRKAKLVQAIGLGFIVVVPYLMKSLSVIGLIAMFLVGGGIIMHGIHPLYEIVSGIFPNGILQSLTITAGNIITALITGIIVLIGYETFMKITKKQH
ncbi:TPA: DUF808 domain-containing protein [Escherichia coli]|nr:DUF808 domain-containing protein [Escherichia coli]